VESIVVIIESIVKSIVVVIESIVKSIVVVMESIVVVESIVIVMESIVKSIVAVMEPIVVVESIVVVMEPIVKSIIVVSAVMPGRCRAGDVGPVLVESLRTGQVRTSIVPIVHIAPFCACLVNPKTHYLKHLCLG